LFIVLDAEVSIWEEVEEVVEAAEVMVGDVLQTMIGQTLRIRITPLIRLQLTIALTS